MWLRTSRKYQNNNTGLLQSADGAPARRMPCMQTAVLTVCTVGQSSLFWDNVGDSSYSYPCIWWCQRSRSQRDITYQHQKRYNSGTVKLLKVKLGENYPRGERNMKHMFKVIRSNTEIAISPPQIARLRLNLVQSFITSQAKRCKMFQVRGQRSRSQRKVMYQQQKHLIRAL